MNPKNTITLAPAAVALAAAAPALAVGAAIGLGLIWLFSDDKKPATANAKTGNEPPNPDAQCKSSGGFVEDLEREWGMRDAPSFPAAGRITTVRHAGSIAADGDAGRSRSRAAPVPVEAAQV